THIGAFRTGIPDLAGFPFDVWGQIAARHWRAPDLNWLGYGDPAGYLPLRAAIAGYLGEARAVRCTPEQIIITNGSQGGIDLAARVLLDPGDAVWMEDPGYAGARGALVGAGMRLIPVPVGPEGLEVATGEALCPTARLAYVSPSHQYPLGVTMSLRRRLDLLAWAKQAGAWVLEDDYDSEYRYTGRPLAALQGLDSSGRVIYIGTFSKVLFPALRLGYVVVPPDLVQPFGAARALIDRHSPTVDQAILADFIAEGHFARHIRRMRERYAERQGVLAAELRRILPNHLAVTSAAAGMFLVATLPAGSNDRTLTQRLAARGITAGALSIYYHGPAPRHALLLGYAAFTPQQIRTGVATLATVLRSAPQFQPADR
ncbi:MAG: PLP-dependent aminotransferase family protein, partial [Ktedonobacterales bacterium]|nr:PLP-dependent aminotransferase family protein [Ktedonobacterales bacterium]